MAVSKRLRFEVFRRDNHACRYCGKTAPDVPLTVDHVVPVALGGCDDPSNLVTACRDCNSGKSSVPSGAPLVDDVAADALRWAKAMEVVAAARAAEREELKWRCRSFVAKWEKWTYSNGEPVELPQTFFTSIDQFIRAGLDLDDLLALIDIAMASRATDTWRYFCGCAWRRIAEAQEAAREVLDAWDAYDEAHKED